MLFDIDEENEDFINIVVNNMSALLLGTGSPVRNGYVHKRDAMFVLFSLGMSHYPKRSSNNAINGLVRKIYENIIESGVSNYAYLYSLLKTNLIAPDALINEDADTFERSLISLIRYSPNVRVQVESLKSLSEAEKDGHFFLDFEVEENAIKYAEDGVVLTVTAYTPLGDVFSEFDTIECTSISRFQRSSEALEKGTQVSILVNKESRKIQATMPTLLGGLHSIKLEYSLVATRGKGTLNNSINGSADIPFYIKNKFELGSVRVGKSSAANPKASDLMLLQREKSILSPGDVSFFLKSDNGPDTTANLFHLKFTLLSQYISAPTEAIFILNYAESGKKFPLRIGIKQPKARGSRRNEYIFEISVDIAMLYSEFPKSFPESGYYELSFYVGDDAVKSQGLRELGVVYINLPSSKVTEKDREKPNRIYETPLLHESDVSLGLLPEKEHRVNLDAVRSPQWIYISSVVLIILVLFLFLVGLLYYAELHVVFNINLGCSINSLVFCSATCLICALYTLYWLGHPLFDFAFTVTCVPVLVAVLVYFGNVDSVKLDQHDQK